MYPAVKPFLGVCKSLQNFLETNSLQNVWQRHGGTIFMEMLCFVQELEESDFLESNQNFKSYDFTSLLSLESVGCPRNQWVVLRVWFVFHISGKVFHTWRKLWGKTCSHFLLYKIRSAFSWKKFCTPILYWCGYKQNKDLTLESSSDSHRRNTCGATETVLGGCFPATGVQHIWLV